MASTQCDISAAKAEPGCVQLRVMTERNGLRSQHVQACSQYGESMEPPQGAELRLPVLTCWLNGQGLIRRWREIMTIL